MAQKSFSVIFPVQHDGKTYKKGSTVKMDDKSAAYLVARGIIAPAKEEPVDPNSGMADPIVGQPKAPEAAATQLTADPGIPQQG